jgi:hypothetical protein
MPAKKLPSYYVLESFSPKQMLLFGLCCDNIEDDWSNGRAFVEPPATPLIVGIQPGYEKEPLLDYFGTPAVMSNRFYQVLVDAGVDNLDVYDAILEGKDGKTRHEGFKAFNVIGLVSATDMQKTEFSPENDSRLIDASIDSLVIDPKKAGGLLMFRLAEYCAAVIVHESLKRALEKHKFPEVVFTPPESFIS